MIHKFKISILKSLILITIVVNFFLEVGEPPSSKMVNVMSSSFFISDKSDSETPSISLDFQKIKPRIVNGSDASIENNGWQVAILRKNGDFSDSIWERQFCGGSIISETWILTAAHCVTGRNPKGLMVGAGASTLSTSNLLWDENGQLVSVKSILIHPKYNSQSFENDIALLKISKPLRFEGGEISGISLRPLNKVLLPSSGATNWWAKPGTEAKISGWGSVDPLGESYPSTLQEARVQIIDTPGVNSCGNWAEFESQTMVCAYGIDGELISDSCFADSGGPLTVNKNGKTFILGIVSFGNEECADVNFPGVYTRVSAFSKWIESKTKIRSTKFEFEIFSTPALSSTNPVIGEMISANVAGWDPVDTIFKYQWYADNKIIKKATNSTYVVKPSDLGKRIHVSITGSYPGYNSKQILSLKTSLIVE